MCVGRRSAPTPPPLPAPRPIPPKPEKTAERVLVGTNRPSISGQQTTAEGGKKRTGQRTTRARRLGTAMLRIPLTDNQGSSDLRY